MTAPAKRPRSRKSGRLTPLASGQPVPVNPQTAALLELIDDFCSRYANPKTAGDYRRTLRQLFRHTGKRHPAELTEADLLDFCTHGAPANNTVYQRSSKLRTFLRWCLRTGLIDHNPGEALSDRDCPLRSFSRTYGKVQAPNPGRWLTHDQAYGQLIATCQDGTLIGLRDEIVIRLGLMGMRLSEISNLRLDNLRHLPTITWTGKRHKPRQATAGASLVGALRRLLAAYPDPTPDSPVICRQTPGAARHGAANRIDWHHQARQRTLFYIVNDRAKKAGLGHVAPHDLRRSAAGILHQATTPDGAHHFDLLDIQKVLGHTDPATTMRSYLDPMNTEVLDRAAAFLD